MKCTQITEVADDDGWDNNYLCVPQNSPLNLKWSSNGTIPGASCINIHEGADRNDWWDNYLCAESTLLTIYNRTVPYISVYGLWITIYMTIFYNVFSLLLTSY